MRRALLALGLALALALPVRAQMLQAIVGDTHHSSGGAPTAAIDGSATATSTAQTCVVSLTTAHSPDVIIVQSKSTPASNDGSISGIADGAGLTWASRQKQTYGTTGVAEEWYAIASGTLSSDSITVTYVSNGAGYSTRCTAFGISGANTGSPFDGNAAIPATGSQSGGSSEAVTVSTNAAKTMLVSLLDLYTGSFGTVTRPSGFAQILGTGGLQDSAYSVVSSAQSSVSESFSWSGGTGATALIIDAVVSN